MKKFLIILTLLFLISPVFAKTVQCVKKYQVYCDYYDDSTEDVTPSIQSMINKGWKVVLITPISVKVDNCNPTDYVIVLFEREE
jgi:hypothetical protein